jgi:hypothetical protein
MSALHEFVLGAVIVCVFAVVAYVAVRGIVGMHGDQGYGSKWTSGIAGAMGEIDRIVRPSVENVVEAKEAADKQTDDVGGE